MEDNFENDNSEKILTTIDTFIEVTDYLVPSNEGKLTFDCEENQDLIDSIILLYQSVKDNITFSSYGLNINIKNPSSGINVQELKEALLFIVLLRKCFDDEKAHDIDENKLEVTFKKEKITDKAALCLKGTFNLSFFENTLNELGKKSDKIKKIITEQKDRYLEKKQEMEFYLKEAYDFIADRTEPERKRLEVAKLLNRTIESSSLEDYKKLTNKILEYKYSLSEKPVLYNAKSFVDAYHNPAGDTLPREMTDAEREALEKLIWMIQNSNNENKGGPSK